MRRPTIHEALRTKLGREPSHAELCADVRRILAEPLVARSCSCGQRYFTEQALRECAADNHGAPAASRFALTRR